MAKLEIWKDRDAIVACLVTIRDSLARERIKPLGGVDLRLVVHGEGTWGIATGDVSYDTAHGVYCAAGTIRYDDVITDLESLADDLIADLEDQAAADDEEG